MNVFLWILQIGLALHTGLGAIWKSSNSERSIPSLGAIPHGVWQAMIVVELFCAIGLIAPAFGKRFAILAPVSAALIGAEMLFFSGVDLASGSSSMGSVIYWLVVAAISAFIVYGRLAPKTTRRRVIA